MQPTPQLSFKTLGTISLVHMQALGNTDIFMQENSVDGETVSKILQTSPNNNSLPEGVWSLEYRGMIDTTGMQCEVYRHVSLKTLCH